MNRSSLLFIISLIAFLIPAIGWSQPLPPANPLPVDGGLGILIAAGAAYGVKRYRASVRNQ